MIKNVAFSARSQALKGHSFDGLCSFLELGYYLDYRDSDFVIDLTGVQGVDLRGIGRDELLARAQSLFRASISRGFATAGECVVPISGGFDSRAVLAGLLEHTDAESVHTYTFGVPGTYDYELGRRVGRALGTKHTSFNLAESRYTADELLRIAQRTRCQTVLFHHGPVSLLDEAYGGMTIWSGFLGEVVSGAHRPKVPARDLAEARRRFIAANRYVRSTTLTPSGSNIDSLVDNGQVGAVGSITLEECLDLANRQPKFIRPHLLMDGYRYVTPFHDQELIRFLLSLPPEERVGQRFYRDMLAGAFPRAFAYATKTTRGLPVAAPRWLVEVKRGWDYARFRLMGGQRRSVNYLNIGTAIRERADIRAIVVECIHDLGERRILEWLDVQQLLKDHLSGVRDHTDALIVLTSLEIHCRAREFR